MKIAIIHAVDENVAALWEAVRVNHEEYIGRHGYHGIVEKPADIHHVFMGKWKLAQKYLKDYDAVALLDVDTLFMNQAISFEHALHGQAVWSRQMYVSSDCHGLNAGVIFVRNTPWAHAVIDHVLRLGPRYSCCNCDQTALLYRLIQEPQEKWLCVPQRTMNSYDYSLYGIDYPEGQYQDGDFILHLPGLSAQQRAEQINKYLSKVIR